MIAAGFFSFEWAAWLTVVILSMCVLFVCAMVAIPWTTAHLRFRGRWAGAKNELDAADFLGRHSNVCLAGVFFFSLLSYDLMVSRSPAKWFTTSIFWVPVLWTFPLLLVVWGGVFKFFEGASKIRRETNLAQIWAPVGSGVVAIIAVAVVVGLIVGVGNPSLWPQMRKSPLSVLTTFSFLYLMAFVLFSSALTGGVMLMLVGRRSFLWERGEPISMGARLICLGASTSLSGLILLIALMVVWLISERLDPIREIMHSSRPLVLFMAIVLLGCILGLLELFLSILRWRGNAPRASLAVAALLFATVFCAISVYGLPQIQSPGQILLPQVPGLPRQ